MRIIPVIIGSLMVIMTALPLLKNQAWWIRIFDFPRLQIVFVSLLALAWFLWVSDDLSVSDAVFVIVVSISVGYQAYMIFPYTRFARPQTELALLDDPTSHISLLFSNVQEDNRDSARLKQVIRTADADIVLLVETDEWWMNAVSDALVDYPNRVLQPLSNTYGMLFYSRLELIDTEVKFLVQDDIPSIHGRLRLRSGQLVEFRCLHPRPPVPGEFENAEPRDAEIIIVGKQNRENDLPFIVFGDLNDVAWSRTNYLFQNISGLLDPRVGRGFYHTFHARIPFLRFPLDHLFHSDHFRLVDFHRMDYVGSDHFPVYGKLSYEPAAHLHQEVLVPEVEEILEAEEKAAFARKGLDQAESPISA